jgi:aspartyl-tRNA(Asn)/glutamyl-tRNA(Gln) amidotransferase subunit A
VRNLMLRLTSPFNVTGHPAIALPVGPTSSGLPCSAQLVGARQETDRLLRIALAVEDVQRAQISGVDRPRSGPAGG